MQGPANNKKRRTTNSPTAASTASYQAPAANALPINPLTPSLAATGGQAANNAMHNPFVIKESFFDDMDAVDVGTSSGPCSLPGVPSEEALNAPDMMTDFDWVLDSDCLGSMAMPSTKFSDSDLHGFVAGLDGLPCS